MSTTYHIEDSLILMRNFTGRVQQYFPSGSRMFVSVIPPEHVQPMMDAGWNVKYNRAAQTWWVLVKIDPAYDVDLSHLDSLGFNKAELFLEGRDWVHGGREGMTAFLISITPKL